MRRTSAPARTTPFSLWTPLVPLVLVSLLTACSDTDRFTRLPTAPSPASPEASPSAPTPTHPASPPPPAASPLPSLAGDYTLTATANGCSAGFPAEFRRRTYTARLEEDNNKVTVILSGPSLGPGATTAGYKEPYVQSLWGEIMPTGQVRLTNFLGNDQWIFVADQASQSHLLTILVDEASLTVTRNGLSGSFAGAFLMYPDTLDRTCVATDHPFELSR